MISSRRGCRGRILSVPCPIRFQRTGHFDLRLGGPVGVDIGFATGDFQSGPLFAPYREFGHAFFLRFFSSLRGSRSSWMRTIHGANYPRERDSLLALYPQNERIMICKYITSSNKIYVPASLPKKAESIEPTADLQMKIEMYPNPSSFQHTIILNETMNVRSCTMYDIFGKELSKDQYAYTINKNNIYTNYNLASGVYMLKVVTDQGVFMQRLLIVRK
jgi:hypothetical protein